MAREIKFRAWAKEVFENDELAYGGFMIQPNEIKMLYLQNISTLMDGPRGTGIECFVQGSFLPGMGHLEKWKFDEIELMQYTGITDRNGKDIYEGDIVTEHHAGLMFEPDFYQIQVVEWKEFGFIPFMRVIGDSRHDFANNLKEFIVIGNIYEHPQLLKEAG